MISTPSGHPEHQEENKEEEEEDKEEEENKEEEEEQAFRGSGKCEKREMSVKERRVFSYKQFL